MSYLDWKVGDTVVCVDAGPSEPDAEWYPGEEPVVGKTYTIDAIFPDFKGVMCITCVGLKRSPMAVLTFGTDRIGYGVWRFRKVQPRTTDISLFTAMLTGAKEREPA